MFYFPCRKGDPTYLERAQTYLSSLLLSSTYFNSAATDGWEALLRESSSAWGDPATGSVTGDYFLLETMASAGANAVFVTHYNRK